MTLPTWAVPTLEPVPHPECQTCTEASSKRAEAHMTGRSRDVRQATEIIRQHSAGHKP